MRYNHLVPELSVSDIKKSLAFYVGILGFRVEYERPEKGFAYVSYQGSQVMLDEGNKRGSPWYTGPMTYPRGRGVHFQIDTDDCKGFERALRKHHCPIKSAPKKHWFRAGTKDVGVLGLLVMDPDGYLLMFNQALGNRPHKR